MYGIRSYKSNPYKLDKRDEPVNTSRLKWSRNQPVTQSKKIAKRENLKKTNQPDTSKFCTYYIKFGSCRNGKSCRFEHDPKRIRTCPEVCISSNIFQQSFFIIVLPKVYQNWLV